MTISGFIQIVEPVLILDEWVQASESLEKKIVEPGDNRIVSGRGVGIGISTTLVDILIQA